VGLQHKNFQRLAQMRWHPQFKELVAPAVAPEIHCVIGWIDPSAISMTPARRNLAQLKPRAHFGEPGFNIF